MIDCLLFKDLLYSVCTRICLLACMFLSVCAVPTVTRRGHWIPLELELLVIMNHHVGAWSQIWLLWKKSVLLTAELPFQLHISFLVGPGDQTQVLKLTASALTTSLLATVFCIKLSPGPRVVATEAVSQSQLSKAMLWLIKMKRC